MGLFIRCTPTQYTYRMAKLFTVCFILKFFFIGTLSGQGALISTEMCKYIQNLIKQFEEDNGTCTSVCKS